MPSTARSDKWFVRIDGSKEFLSERLKNLSNCVDTQKILALFHVGDKKDNPHTHFVINCAETQQQSFAVRLKKLFDIEKKHQYSIKVWDGCDGALSYMFHEVDEVVLCNKGYSDDDLQRYRELNSKVQEVIAVNKQRGGRVCDRVIEEYRNNGEHPERDDIIRKFCEMIRDGEMYEPGDFMMIRYVEEVYCKTREPSRWNSYVRERTERLLSRL